MRKRHLVVGVVMLVASAVSYELVQRTGAISVTAEVLETVPSTGIHAAAAPVVMRRPVREAAPIAESVSDAALFGATGAALFVIAAGVRRRGRSEL